MHELRLGPILWQIYVGDISQAAADAVVSAANSMGHMRGGASQALRLRGGDAIEEEARGRAPIKLGSAIATTAGGLDAKWVIHAPTIREPVETTSPARIRGAAQAAARLAGEMGARSIAIPALGTGVGEVDPGSGAAALVDGLSVGLAGASSVELVKIVVRRDDFEDAFVRALTSRGAAGAR